MAENIKVAILDDHPAIIDGYQMRLKDASDIKIVAVLYEGEDLEPTLARIPVDVLLLDVNVPTSQSNPNPYPILHEIPRLLSIYPNLSVLAISMHAQPALIQAVMDAGASGYILKDDYASNRELAAVIRSVATGGIHMSQPAYQLLRNHPNYNLSNPLSNRQLEVLSICAAYPDASTAEIASRLNIAHSTLRNLLSQTYLKLDVRSKPAAIAKARQLGLITPELKTIPLDAFQIQEH